MAGFKKKQDDAYCNAPVRHVEDTRGKTAASENHEVSASSGVKHPIK